MRGVLPLSGARSKGTEYRQTSQAIHIFTIQDNTSKMHRLKQIQYNAVYAKLFKYLKTQIKSAYRFLQSNITKKKMWVSCHKDKQNKNSYIKSHIKQGLQIQQEIHTAEDKKLLEE